MSDHPTTTLPPSGEEASTPEAVADDKHASKAGGDEANTHDPTLLGLARLLDVIIVGGGPAGLSAALILGRARRKVLVVDAGHPRNAAAAEMRGYLSRDGMPPAEFLQICREQLGSYPNVELRSGEVLDTAQTKEGFVVHMGDGQKARSRLLLLATGVVDELPELEGVKEFYGKSVHQCPYCDGWEHRDEPIAVYGRGKTGAEFALEMTGWSRNVVLCSDGPAELGRKEKGRLARRGVPVIELPIARLEGVSGQLSAICFRNGERLERRALFFLPTQRPRTHLPGKLGCRFGDEASVEVCEKSESDVPGVYVAGNASVGLQMVIMAAADGAKAGFMMNQQLNEEECA